MATRQPLPDTITGPTTIQDPEGIDGNHAHRRQCHTIETGSHGRRGFCGARLNRGNGTHSRSSCESAGHEHCEVCDLIASTDGYNLGNPERG